MSIKRRLDMAAKQVPEVSFEIGGEPVLWVEGKGYQCRWMQFATGVPLDAGVYELYLSRDYLPTDLAKYPTSSLSKESFWQEVRDRASVGEVERIRP